MRERIQKRLAARGIGSRRQVEAWIVAGRITVNGKLAEPGQAVDERDDIRLDGRRLRVGGEKGKQHEGLAYHRPPQESVRAQAGDAESSSLERLPKSAGRRWIPVSPLAATDGGLELFLTDGKLAAALMRRGHEVSCEYSLRVRGALDETLIDELLAAAEQAGTRDRVQTVELAGGEGANRWINIRCLGLRPRDLKPLFEGLGLEVNRAMRTRFGPIAMDRALARGRSRPLTDDELQALAHAVGEQAPKRPRVTGSRKSGRSRLGQRDRAGRDRAG